MHLIVNYQLIWARPLRFARGRVAAAIFCCACISTPLGHGGQAQQKDNPLCPSRKIHPHFQPI